MMTSPAGEYVSDAVGILRQNGSGRHADAVVELLAERDRLRQALQYLERAAPAGSMLEKVAQEALL